VVNKFRGRRRARRSSVRPIDIDDHACGTLGEPRAGVRLAAEVPTCGRHRRVAGDAVPAYIGDIRRYEYTVIGTR